MVSEPVQQPTKDTNTEDTLNAQSGAKVELELIKVEGVLYSTDRAELIQSINRGDLDRVVENDLTKSIMYGSEREREMYLCVWPDKELPKNISIFGRSGVSFHGSELGFYTDTVQVYGAKRSCYGPFSGDHPYHHVLKDESGEVIGLARSQIGKNGNRYFVICPYESNDVSG